jgi:hypothetical protein
LNGYGSRNMVVNQGAHFLEDGFVLVRMRTRASVPYAERPDFSSSFIVSIVDVAQNLREELGPLREMVGHLWPLHCRASLDWTAGAAVSTLRVYGGWLRR